MLLSFAGLRKKTQKHDQSLKSRFCIYIIVSETQIFNAYTICCNWNFIGEYLCAAFIIKY